MACIIYTISNLYAVKVENVMLDKMCLREDIKQYLRNTSMLQYDLRCTFLYFCRDISTVKQIAIKYYL
jgi:hypothetical protein